GVAALYRPIQVVPVVENATLDTRSREDVEILERLVCLQEARKRKAAVETPDVFVGGNDNDAMPLVNQRPNDIACRSRSFQSELQFGDEGSGVGGTNDDATILAGMRCEGYGRAEQAAKTSR